MSMISDTSLLRRPRECRLLQLLLVCALLLLLLGLALPLMTLEQFWLIQNSFSLLSGLSQMLQEGHWVLGLLISCFSVLLPLLKIGVLFRVLSLSDQARVSSVSLLRSLHWMHLYGKWAMLDVFVVAVLLAAVKLGALAQVQIHSGLYAFSASVLLTMAITARVTWLTQDPGSVPAGS